MRFLSASLITGAYVGLASLGSQLFGPAPQPESASPSTTSSDSQSTSESRPAAQSQASSESQLAALTDEMDLFLSRADAPAITLTVDDIGVPNSGQSLASLLPSGSAQKANVASVPEPVQKSRPVIKQVSASVELPPVADSDSAQQSVDSENNDVVAPGVGGGVDDALTGQFVTAEERQLLFQALAKAARTGSSGAGATAAGSGYGSMWPQFADSLNGYGASNGGSSGGQSGGSSGGYSGVNFGSLWNGQLPASGGSSNAVGDYSGFGSSQGFETAGGVLRSLGSGASLAASVASGSPLNATLDALSTAGSVINDPSKFGITNAQFWEFDFTAGPNSDGDVTNDGVVNRLDAEAQFDDYLVYLNGILDDHKELVRYSPDQLSTIFDELNNEAEGKTFGGDPSDAAVSPNFVTYMIIEFPIKGFYLPQAEIPDNRNPKSADGVP